MIINSQETLYEVTYRCPVLHVDKTEEVRAESAEAAVEKVRRPFYTILKVKKKDA